MMQISDIIRLPDGKTVHIVISDEPPQIHAGDMIIDNYGNQSLVIARGKETRCFGNMFNISVIIEGTAQKGAIKILPAHSQQSNR